MPFAQTISASRVSELYIADVAESWKKAGFVITKSTPFDFVQVGDTRMHLIGQQPNGRRGIVAWALETDNLDTPKVDILLDSLQTRLVPESSNALGQAIHPNKVVGIDHIVVTSPNAKQTVGAFSVLNLFPRRVIGDNQITFFKTKNAVVELIQGTPPFAKGQTAEEILKESCFFGLTFNSEDFDETLNVLGPLARVPRDAVQGKGRRIVTLNNGLAGISVNTAFMSLPQATAKM